VKINLIILFAIAFFLGGTNVFAQDSLVVVTDTVRKPKKQKVLLDYDPLAPSKAAFYSAVLPGLGQAYNRKYWKIPIVYAGIATGIYFYSQQNKEYNRFRDAYKRRLAGFTDDEFFGSGQEALVSLDRLEDAQKRAQKNRDISLIVSVAFYLVNIIDANVDAHLRQYNVNDDLSFNPMINLDPVTNSTNYGLSLRYSFAK
jgi:hypothetical protein